MTTKPNIITYPIPGNKTGGLLHTYGKPTSPNLILCCGGFPDDHEPFTPLALRLSKENCFVGITCFPGFEFKSYQQSKFSGYKRSGYDFDEVCACIREAVKHLFQKVEGSPKFTIILHDWGVVPGMMYVNRSMGEKSPHAPSKIVLLDVLTPPHKEYKDVPKQAEVAYPLNPSIHEILVCLSYRFGLATSFAWLRFLSDILGLINFVFMFGIVMLLRLNPTRSIDNKLIDERAEKATSKLDFYRHLVYMCYPYYYMFLALFSGTGFEEVAMPLDLKVTPILYIYGKEKNVMFHDWSSLAILEREEKEGRSESRVVAVDGAGHWMYVQKLDVCFEEIKKFVK